MDRRNRSVAYLGGSKSAQKFRQGRHAPERTNPLRPPAFHTRHSILLHRDARPGCRAVRFFDVPADARRANPDRPRCGIHALPPQQETKIDGAVIGFGRIRSWALWSAAKGLRDRRRQTFRSLSSRMGGPVGFGGHKHTAAALADAGFVVAAIDHPGDTASDQSRVD